MSHHHHHLHNYVCLPTHVHSLAIIIITIIIIIQRSHAAQCVPSTISPPVSIYYKAQTVAVVDGSLNLLSNLCHFFLFVHSVLVRYIHRLPWCIFIG